MAKAPKPPKAPKAAALGSEAKALAASGMNAATISTVLLANIPLEEIKSSKKKIKILENAALHIKELNRTVNFAENAQAFAGLGNLAKAIAPLSKIAYTDLIKANTKIGLLAKIIPKMQEFAAKIGPNQKIITDALLNTTKAAVALAKMSKKDIKLAIKNKAKISPLETSPTVASSAFEPSTVAPAAFTPPAFAPDIATGTSGKTSAEKLAGKRGKITIKNLSQQIFENNTLLKEIKMMIGLKKGEKATGVVSKIKEKGKGLFSFLMPFLKKLLFSPLLLAGAAFLFFANRFWKRVVKIGANAIQGGMSIFKTIGTKIYDAMAVIGGAVKGHFTKLAGGIWARMNTLGAKGANTGWFARMGIGIWKWMTKLPGIRHILKSAPESAKLAKMGALAATKGITASTVKIPKTPGVKTPGGQTRVPKGKPGAGQFAKIGKVTAEVKAGWIKVLGKRVLKYIPFVGLAAGMAIAYSYWAAGDYARASVAMVSAIIGTIPGGFLISLLLDAGLILSELGIKSFKIKNVPEAAANNAMWKQAWKMQEMATGVPVSQAEKTTRKGSPFNKSIGKGLRQMAIQKWKKHGQQVPENFIELGKGLPGFDEKLPGNQFDAINFKRYLWDKDIKVDSLEDQIRQGMSEVPGRTAPAGNREDGVIFTPTLIRKEGDNIVNTSITNIIPDVQKGNFDQINRTLASS